ncbi:zinc ribbon domain-containing protein [bacterium]|nr:zinc ribbon domain-containing protein [bacterium]
MPIYEYQCNDCGKMNEILIRNVDEKPTCECGSSNLKKIFSTFAVSDAASSTAMPDCAGGSCGMPSSPCSSGMCGL